jgi:hypothetical protein
VPDDLAADRALARTLGEPSAAIAATHLTAKLVGLLGDRKERGEPGDFTGLQSEADVIALVRAALGEAQANTLAAALTAPEPRQSSRLCLPTLSMREMGAETQQCLL